jgi:hypothetical protein
MKKIITALILIFSIVAVWYFYPCLTFRGTYSRTNQNGTERTIIIDDLIQVKKASGEYSINYLDRTLWSPSILGLNTIKLSYSKIYERDFKTGKLTELKKTKSEPIN